MKSERHLLPAVDGIRLLGRPEESYIAICCEVAGPPPWLSWAVLYLDPTSTDPRQQLEQIDNEEM